MSHDVTAIKALVGARVRAARTAAGLTQDQLAGSMGLSRTSVANIEAGRQDMSISRMAGLAARLDVDLAALIAPGGLPAPPHDVRIRRVFEVTCETCGGLVIDAHPDRAVAVVSRRDHIVAASGTGHQDAADGGESC